MTLLPIVERELRVASRRRATRWWRVLAAVLATLVIMGAMFLSSIAGFGTVLMGGALFHIIAYPAFIFACAAGVLLTSDVISEERREGTLGLLFLTDLRGYDVVLGKLFFTSLRSAYGLLAVFPVMGIAFTFGGVESREFQHICLLLCNALFLSLTMGLAVSCVARTQMSAMNTSLLFMIALVVFLPGLDKALSLLGRFMFVPPLRYLSPGYALSESASIRTGEYWKTMAITNLLGWCLLGLASWLTPRTWKESETRKSRAAKPALATAGVSSRRADLRRRMLDRNPIYWIMSRNRGLHVATRVAALILVLPPAIGFLIRSPALGFLFSTFQLGFLVGFLLKLWVAAHVSRFYVEGKQSGFLESLLATPMDAKEIVHGHWLALLRLLGWPVLILVGVGIWSGFEQIHSMRTIIFSTSSAATANPSLLNNLAIQQIVALVVGAVTTVTSLIGVAWFSMWMGLISNKTSTAVIRTIVFSRILPSIALTFVSGIIMVASVFSINGIGSSGGGSGIWIGQLCSAAVTVGANIWLIFLARGKVIEGFRKYVNKTHSPPRYTLPPPMPANLPAPPIIKA